MAWYPGAVHEPIDLTGGGTNGPMAAYLGLVLHVNAANSTDLHDYTNDGLNNVSCHFQCTYDGTLYQYIDTALSSWCQSDGNDTYLSLETEGFPSEALTAAQVASITGLVGWAFPLHGIPFTVADTVGARGFGWHGMGGAAWGGHTGCPGELRKAQRAPILAAAQAAIASNEGNPDMAGLTDDEHNMLAYLYAQSRASVAAGTTSPAQTVVATLNAERLNYVQIGKIQAALDKLTAAK